MTDMWGKATLASIMAEALMDPEGSWVGKLVVRKVLWYSAQGTL